MKKIKISPTNWQPLDGIGQPHVIRKFEGLSAIDPLSLGDGYMQEIENLTPSKDYPTLATRGGHQLHELRSVTPDPSTAPSLAASGTTSTLPAGTYYVKYTWVTNEGETMASPASSITTSEGQQIDVTLPTFPTEVKSANVYIGEISGSETKQGNTTTTSYVQSSELIAGESLPTENTSNDFTVMSMGVLNSDENLVYMIAGGQWYYTWSSSTSIFTATQPNLYSSSWKWATTNFKGANTNVVLLAANGSDPLLRLNSSGSVTEITGAPTGLNYVVAHDNRVYGAVGNSLKFSALGKDDDWTTVDDAGEITIDDSRGGDITALYAEQGRVVVFKKNSMYELYGTGPSNYQLQTISESIGCVSHQTCVVIDGSLYFVANDGVYRYSGSSPKKVFSLPVQSYFEAISPSYQKDMVGGTEGHNYYLYMGQANGALANKLLVYNPQFNTWSNYKVSERKINSIVVDNHWRYLWVAIEKENVKKFHSIIEDDDGSEISWYFITKPFANRSLSEKNRLYKLWVTLELYPTAVCNIEVGSDIDDQSDFSLVKTIQGDGSSNTPKTVSKTIYLPVDLIFDKHWFMLKLSGTGQIKIREISYQIRSIPLR